MEKIFQLLKKATIGEIIALCTFIFGIGSGIISVIAFVEERYAKEQQIKEHKELIKKAIEKIGQGVNTYSVVSGNSNQ